MNRRAFTALTSFGFGLPLLAGSAHADGLDADDGTAGTNIPAPRSPAFGVAELVTRVAAFYERFTTFKAGFRHSSRYDGLKVPAGSVIFEKPGKMSWRYAGGNRVVSDGTRVQIYASASKQLFDLELAKTQFPFALSFLTERSPLERSFAFTRRDPSPPGFAGRYLLIGEPRQPSPICARLVYDVDAKTHQVRCVQLTGAQGNRTRFDFVGNQLNPRVPPSEFDFNAPRGTSIIRL